MGIFTQLAYGSQEATRDMIYVGSGFCTIHFDFGGLDAQGTRRTLFK